MTTAIHRQVAAAREKSNPRVICRLASGWLVMSEVQVLSGYCLLLPDPVVPHLNALTGQARQQFLSDMSAVGDALMSVTDCVRINYEMLGNLEPALHAHIIPRYASEPEALRTKPIWSYDWQQAETFDLTKQSSLMELIRQALPK